MGDLLPSFPFLGTEPLFRSFPPVSLTAPEPPFSSEWFFLRIHLTREKPCAASRESKDIAAFRKAALALLPAPLRLTGPLWQVHHVLPLFLGGSNLFLSLVPEQIHRWVHNKIKQDTFEMEIGESRLVTIPWRQGRIWTNLTADLNQPVLICQPRPCLRQSKKPSASFPLFRPSPALGQI